MMTGRRLLVLALLFARARPDEDARARRAEALKRAREGGAALRFSARSHAKWREAIKELKVSRPRPAPLDQPPPLLPADRAARDDAGPREVEEELTTAALATATRHRHVAQGPRQWMGSHPAVSSSVRSRTRRRVHALLGHIPVKSQQKLAMCGE